LWLGLIRLGYDDAARDLVERLTHAVSVHGLREYYHPLTGEGMGASAFAWSCLIMEMLAPHPRAASSYLA
jgi:GH15 family glucan-1,4-alpha-glucosidase